MAPTASQGSAESDLHASAWDGDIDKVLKLLAEGADPNWQDSINETALFGAAAWGHSEIVGILLEGGARHDLVSSDGLTPLHWAARANVQTVEVLVSAGANVRAVDQTGALPIDVAHRYGQGDVVRFLKSFGPQIASRRD